MWLWLRANVRSWWVRLTWCFASTVGPTTDRGTYPAWFCDRRRWHLGPHHDSQRGVTWV